MGIATRTRVPGGEAIRFDAGTQARAESLAATLRAFAPELSRAGDSWLVEIVPDTAVTPMLLDVFDAVSDWLETNQLTHVKVHFGDNGYTLLHSSDRHRSALEFLLQRATQLQGALESRVPIEQAKGYLAGRHGLPLEDAFDVLRQAARAAGRRLHEVADEVVAADSLPAEVARAVDAWHRRS